MKFEFDVDEAEMKLKVDTELRAALDHKIKQMVKGHVDKYTFQHQLTIEVDEQCRLLLPTIVAGVLQDYEAIKTAVSTKLERKITAQLNTLLKSNS